MRSQGTHSEVDDAPDPALAVVLEHTPYVRLVPDVTDEGIDDGALLVLFRGVRR